MATSRGAPPRRPPPRSQRLVLVADPEPRLRELLRLAIEPAGFQVVEARTATEALHLARRLRPGAVIADVWLPQPGAFWLLAELTYLRLESGLRIIVTSADCDPELAQAANMLGADYFLSKPFRPTRLVGLLRGPRRNLAGPTPIVIRPANPARVAARGRSGPAAERATILEFPSGRVWTRRGQETAT